jgi:deoxyribodipyrimidine photo-lyase
MSTTVDPLPQPLPQTLPLPGVGAETAWVKEYLGELCCDEPVASPRFRGTQAAADAALAAFDVTGYAAKRSEVQPLKRRGASALSPWIRHGHLSLARVWEATKGPTRDVEKFRDELLWQEYARHTYARLGKGMRKPIRYQPVELETTQPAREPWNRSMHCVASVLDELETDGWMVNQTRMWMASQWTVRHGASWREGEDRFFQHLLDGSRAANRLGWQWTVGAGTGKPYGFSRWQVEKRAPNMCNSCALRNQCPIEKWPTEHTLDSVTPDPRIRSIQNPVTVSGPLEPKVTGYPEAVWLTAESLGDDDPALSVHTDLPAVFVFDEPLLRGLQLSGKRLVFLAERLAELAQTRVLTVYLGDPVNVLNGMKLATTYAPVPGWRTRAKLIQPTAVYPWPWLRVPGTESIASYSAWNRG